VAAAADLFSLLRSRFPRDPAAPLLETVDGRVIRYAEIDRASARYGAALRAAGVRHGDRVVVQVEKSPEALILYLAVLRIGAVYVPLNSAYTGAEVAYFVADAQPRVVVCRPEDEAQMRPLGTAVLTLGADGCGSLLDADAAQDVPPCAAGAGDLAAILYTSGTTGRSKGAMLTHGNLAANALTLREIWEFGTDDVLLHALPIFHAHGLFVAVHCTLLAGARMLFLPRFDAATVLRLLPRATVMMGVPTFYTRLLREPGLDRAVCARMRLFVSGSAPLLAETHREFRERTGHAILERYGMTETGMNTSNPLRGDRVPGSVGPPLPGVAIRVVDEAGCAVSPGEVGVLEVRGANVFPGYWRMPEKTRGEFREDGFFVTGDIARIDERGYVHLVGRAKELIISGGFNVYPKEIEGVLDRLAGVAESAVFGVPHADFGEAVVAAVVGRAELREEGIIAAARASLAPFKAPKRVFFVDELPRNAMGKVLKNVLQERYRATFA
jgi:malonyl-CoA/methylmalonyl-CoA synthetase